MQQPRAENIITLFYRWENRLTEVTWLLRGWSQDWNWHPSLPHLCLEPLAPLPPSSPSFPPLPAARATHQTLHLRAGLCPGFKLLEGGGWLEGSGSVCSGDHGLLPGLVESLLVGSAFQASSRRVQPALGPALALPWLQESSEGNVESAPKPQREDALSISCFLFNVRE